jgi:hypothetical protein
MPARSRSATSRRRSSAVSPAPPGRRSCAQGSWSIARALVTGWTSYDRGPRQTRSNGSDPRTAQSRSARSGGGPLVTSCPDYPCAPADIGREPQPPYAPNASGRAERPVRRGIDRNAHGVSQRTDQAGVCAFSLTSRITQRDGTIGRDAPGCRTLLYPGDPGPHRPAPPRRSRASGRLPEPPACSMIPGWRPPPGPGSPGTAGTRPAARPSRSPVLEPGGIRASRLGSRSPPVP